MHNFCNNGIKLLWARCCSIQSRRSHEKNSGAALCTFMNTRMNAATAKHFHAKINDILHKQTHSHSTVVPQSRVHQQTDTLTAQRNAIRLCGLCDAVLALALKKFVHNNNSSSCLVWLQDFMPAGNQKRILLWLEANTNVQMDEEKHHRLQK